VAYARIDYPGTASIAAATGIAAGTVVNKQTLIIGGNGGAIDITANPQIAAGTHFQILEIWGIVIPIQ